MRAKIFDALAAFFLILAGSIFFAGVFPPYGITKLFVLGGTVVALTRRHRKQDQSIGEILINDYNIERYAALSILSIGYTILQGAVLGSFFGLLIDAVVQIFRNEGNYILSLLIAILMPLVLIVGRVIIEFISLVFKATENLSYLSYIKGEDP